MLNTHLVENWFPCLLNCIVFSRFNFLVVLIVSLTSKRTQRLLFDESLWCVVCVIGHWLWNFEEMGMGNEALDERIIQGETKREEDMLKELSIVVGCLT